MRRRDAWIGAYRYSVAHGYIPWASRVASGVGFGLVLLILGISSGRSWLFTVPLALIWPAAAVYGLSVEVAEYRERARREGWG